MSTLVALSPDPILQFFDNNGVPLVGGKITTLVGGIPYNTFSEPTGTFALPNPIVLNSRGEIATAAGTSSQLFLVPNVVYTFVIQDAVGNTISTPNYVISPITTEATIVALLTANDLGGILYPITAAENLASVTPVNYQYVELDPRRYGVVGDGQTDDSVAVNNWAGVVNASIDPVSTWPTGLIVMCSPIVPSYLPTQNMLGISTTTVPVANSFTWICWSTLRSLPNSITGGGSWIEVNCATFRAQGLTLDGNIANYTTPAGNASLIVNLTADLLLDDCSFINGTDKGVLFQQTVNGRISNCHFDGNNPAGGAGIETNRATDLQFVNCTFNGNGFGSVLRFRSNRITFTNCEANDNTHDGFNTNQGSYAVKYIGCIAESNGDGGFTYASDQTNTGIPGEAESCYDWQQIGCQARNNDSSGIAAYTPVFGVRVIGGAYYNNNGAAGTVAGQGTNQVASSFLNGIYIAAGSQRVTIDTDAYDDRQICTITAASNGAVSATSWVTGLMTAYPQVTFHDSLGAFQGYGTITSEIAGSPAALVGFSPTAFNGVTFASIAAGWTITQRTQHNGVFFDNNCTGSAKVVGEGHLPGPYTFTGANVMSGFTASGQNILLPDETIDYTELLVNPTFDTGVTNWTYNLNGGTATLYTTAGAQLRSPGALQLVGGTSATAGDALLIASGINYFQGTFIEASIWCYATNPGDAQFILLWNPGGTGFLTTVVNHPGGAQARLLRIGAYIPNNSTCSVRVLAQAGKTVYFDTASFRVKTTHTNNLDFSYGLGRFLAQ